MSLHVDKIAAIRLISVYVQKSEILEIFTAPNANYLSSLFPQAFPISSKMFYFAIFDQLYMNLVGQWWRENIPSPPLPSCAPGIYTAPNPFILVDFVQPNETSMSF